MSTDLETLSNSELQPYDPGPRLQELQPLQPDTWGRTDVDTYQRPPQSQGLTLFGSPMPAGTSPQDIQAALGRIGGAYLADMSSLKYPNHLIQSAIQFFMDNATKPLRQVQRHHSFDLKNETGDPLAELFGNYLDKLNGTKAQKTQFLNASLLWLAKLNQKFGQQSAGTQPRTAPPTSDGPLSQLTDAQFERLVQHNEQVKLNTKESLTRKWGEASYARNIQLAQNFLSRNQQAAAHFDQWTGNFPWTHMMNTVECLEYCFDAAVKASIPASKFDMAQEVFQIEALLRDPAGRKLYMADPVLQHKYRVMLEILG